MNSRDIGLTIEGLLLASTPLPASEAFRIVLLPGELFRVPGRQRSLKVVSGSAWVTLDGMDLEVDDGEKVGLEGSKNCALVSAAGEHPVVFEVL